MKTLEQLGISPAPWYVEENTGVLCAKSEYYKHPIVDDCGNFENNNDKRLIAAAPDLYEALRECLEVLDEVEECFQDVDEETSKLMRKAKAALKKAGGAK